MATQTTNTGHGFHAADLIRVPLAALGRFLGHIIDNASRAHEIRALNDLSDAELAARGLTRATIAHYVFRDTFGF
jgi:hypothetical protein